MRVRDVSTTEVVTVGPDTSVKYAGEVMAEHGFAALPVVDDDGRLIGIVAEADVLRDRLPQDPRLHARREPEESRAVPLLVRGVMTEQVRSVGPADDIADVARLFVDQRLRSVPVVDAERLVGIVSRRDLLRALVRPDAQIRLDLVHLVEGYTGDLGAWEVDVVEGLATIRRVRGVPEVSRAVEERALTALARTVGGVVGVRVLAPGSTPAPASAPASAARP